MRLFEVHPTLEACGKIKRQKWDYYIQIEEVRAFIGIEPFKHIIIFNMDGTTDIKYYEPTERDLLADDWEIIEEIKTCAILKETVFRGRCPYCDNWGKWSKYTKENANCGSCGKQIRLVRNPHDPSLVEEENYKKLIELPKRPIKKYQITQCCQCLFYEYPRIWCKHRDAKIDMSKGSLDPNCLLVDFVKGKEDSEKLEKHKEWLKKEIENQELIMYKGSGIGQNIEACIIAATLKKVLEHIEREKI